VLQPLLTSSCPRRPHQQISYCSNFSIPHFVDEIFGVLLCFIDPRVRFYFLQIHLLNSGRMAKLLPGQSFDSICTWFAPLPVCDHSQGVYFPPNRRRSIVFLGLFQQKTSKQTKKVFFTATAMEESSTFIFLILPPPPPHFVWSYTNPYVRVCDCVYIYSNIYLLIHPSIHTYTY